MSDDLLRPRYADAFRCIGSSCEDSCCEGWSVFVDKATYKQYRADPSLRRMTAGHVERIKEDGDNFKYARIQLAGSRCPFLTTDRLCAIQKQHGPEALSKTCSRYPRAWTRFDGHIEKALLLSCPEAARLVLLSPGLLAAEETLERSQNEGGVERPSLAHHLRCLTLGVLQDRSYPLWQRLLVLGMVCRRIGDLEPAQRAANAPELIGRYAEMMLRGDLRSHLDGIPARREPQLDLVLKLIRLRFQVEQPRDDFAAIVADLLVSINHSPGEPLDGAAQRYAAACRHYDESFARHYPALLENYLVNYVFCSRFPFADKAGHRDGSMDAIIAFLLMAFHYCLLHSLLVGSAARHREKFTAARAVHVVQAFARAVEHNLRFEEEMRTLAASPGLRQTETLAALLRN